MSMTETDGLIPFHWRIFCHPVKICGFEVQVVQRRDPGGGGPVQGCSAGQWRSLGGTWRVVVPGLDSFPWLGGNPGPRACLAGLSTLPPSSIPSPS